MPKGPLGYVLESSEVRGFSAQCACGVYGDEGFGDFVPERRILLRMKGAIFEEGISVLVPQVVVGKSQNSPNLI